MSPHKSDRQGLFMGRKKGQKVMLLSLAAQGQRALTEEPYLGGDDQGHRAGAETVGSVAVRCGTGTGRSWAGNRRTQEPRSSPPASPLPEPLCNPGLGQLLWPFLPSQAVAGERLSPSKHLIPTLVFWQEK